MTKDAVPPAATGVPLSEALQRALALHRADRLGEAEQIYRAILAAVPGQFDALHMMGVLATQRGQLAEGADLIGRAVAARPTSVEALGNLANVLNRMGRFAETLAVCERALVLDPRLADVRNTKGLALLGLGRHGEALASFDHVLSIAPQHAVAWCNRGNALASLDRQDDAVQSYDRAVAIEPGLAEGWHNRGNTLRASRRFAEALSSYDRALVLSPDSAEIHERRGDVLREVGRYAEAIASYTRALALRPDLAGALEMRGFSLHYLGRNEDAARDFARAVELEPDRAFALGMVSLLRLHNAEWSERDALLRRLTGIVRSGRGGVEPFVFTVQSESPGDQLACAQSTARLRVPPSPHPLWTGERYTHDRIRVAYLSADFREHATAYLLTEILERHDRARFEVTGLSWSSEPPSGISARIAGACETFVDIRERSDAQVAQWMREREVDVAIDLMGFTNGARPRIFAERPAPVQVNFLGYPGTLGSPYHDYVIADETVIPVADRIHYAEQVAYLPGSYQPNDRQRPIAPGVPSRADCGLPARGFVFCCFNGLYKITPAMFGVWMRLLAAVEGSVLWLLAGTDAAASNLRREAQSRGIAPERLLFAPRTPLRDHLARHRLADLFLDTLPCNAHTTASDALWAGLPVLTCLGHTFAGRVGASVVRAADLPELVTTSLFGYEALALRLATHADELSRLKARLSQGLMTCALFDSERFCRHLEDAYARMVERSRGGFAPQSFTAT